MSEPLKFCVMTTGRSGSTALIEALESDDVLLPNNLFDCPDSELLHPKRRSGYVQWFSERLQRDIQTPSQLIDAFYTWPTEANFVGFKSMPNRHKNFAAFARQSDVQFITLVREDVPSTVASFQVAKLRSGQWSRQGQTQTEHWTFTESEVPSVSGNLAYILMARHLMDRIPGAIRLVYERICAPDFRNQALDEYFGRRIRLGNPRLPVCASSYVTNWEVFSRFIDETSEQINALLEENGGESLPSDLSLRINTNRPLRAEGTSVGSDLRFRVSTGNQLPGATVPVRLISLITICKNRLHHLQQTLPHMLQQSNAEVIVVDYGCEQDTATWVREHHPEARIVEVRDDAEFCAARARNLGAMEASGDVLFFVDADVLIQRDLGEWAKRAVKPGYYYRYLNPPGRSFVGTCICNRDDFQRLEGYDEAFRLWGGEDMDFYERLNRMDVTVSPLPDDALSGIKHGDEIRQLGWARDRAMLSLANQIYCLIKFDISLLAGVVPPLTTRLDIKAQIDNMVQMGSDESATENLVLMINLDKRLDTGAFEELGGGLKRQLVYELKRSKGKTPSG